MTNHTPNPTPRWHYRFDNYKRAFALLRQAIEQYDIGQLTDLEKEGLIQRFEYCWELAWNVLADYLNNAGVILPERAPRRVIKAALGAGIIGIITDGDHWMQALDDRNKMAHVYNQKRFAEVIDNISKHYLGLFDELYMYLLQKRVDTGEEDG